MGRRENTFRIDFANVPKKPDNAKVHKFCATILGLKQGEVLRIQNSRTLGVSFVKVVDLELAQKICEEHDNKHDITVDGKKYPLRITLEDGAVEVRLYDLSEDVSDQKIADFLSRYGDVISIREQRCGADTDFPGISTGVRIAKMVVKRNIESWVTVDGEVTSLSYFGQLQTCRHCREYIHIGATCVQNKKLLVQKSYADAAKQTPSQKTSPLDKTNTTAPGVNQTKNTSNQPARFEQNSAQSEKMLPPKPIPQRKQQSLLPPPLGLEQQFPLLPTPPGSVPPSGSGSLAPFTGQQPPASSGALRKTVSGKSDGNETDSSVGSSSSRRHLRPRPPSGKKPRVEDNSDDKREGSEEPL